MTDDFSTRQDMISRFKTWPFTCLLIIVPLSLGAWAVFDARQVSVGFCSGGILGYINFSWLGRIIQGAISEGRAASYTLKYLAKICFVVISSVLLVFYRLVEPLSFVAGFSIVLVVFSVKGKDFLARG